MHDTMILEGAGTIQERTEEHVGYTNRPIIAARRTSTAAARQAGRRNSKR